MTQLSAPHQRFIYIIDVIQRSFSNQLVTDRPSSYLLLWTVSASHSHQHTHALYFFLILLFILADEIQYMLSGDINLFLLSQVIVWFLNFILPWPWWPCRRQTHYRSRSSFRMYINVLYKYRNLCSFNSLKTLTAIRLLKVWKISSGLTPCVYVLQAAAACMSKFMTVQRYVSRLCHSVRLLVL